MQLTILILVALTLAFTMCLRSIQEDNALPVQTNVESASISTIPFPAITVNRQEFIDDWAILRYNFFLQMLLK